MKEDVAGRSSAKTGGRAVTGGPGQTTPHEAMGWLTALEKFESRVARRMVVEASAVGSHLGSLRRASANHFAFGGPCAMKMRTVPSLSHYDDMNAQCLVMIGPAKRYADPLRRYTEALGPPNALVLATALSANWPLGSPRLTRRGWRQSLA